VFTFQLFGRLRYGQKASGVRFVGHLFILCAAVLGPWPVHPGRLQGG
jgi:hypothetical protein